MRISDWSSDVCSSDLRAARLVVDRLPHRVRPPGADPAVDHPGLVPVDPHHAPGARGDDRGAAHRSEEHTSELQSLVRTSYAVFCLKKQTYHLCIHSLSRGTRYAPHTTRSSPYT